MDIISVDKEYLPQIMWLYNDKLSSSDTKAQLMEFEKKNTGGILINASCGAESKYLGDEWFRNINQSISFCAQNNIKTYISDGNYSHGGVGSRIVNTGGVDFQQKFLCMEEGSRTNDRTVIYKDGYHFYYDVNAQYADVLSPDAASALIGAVYENNHSKLTEHFGGFFSYNPTVSCGKIPWSFILPQEYKKEYSEELLDRLTELFRPVGNYRDTRIKFYTLVTKLFAKNFLYPLFKWCEDNNFSYTALFSEFSSYSKQISSYGSAAALYEYMTYPSIVCSSLQSDAAVIEAASVSRQIGKSKVTAHILPNCGYNVTPDTVWENAVRNLLYGATSLIIGRDCYSLRGFRKHTAAGQLHGSAYRFQSLGKMYNSLGRLTKLLCEGESVSDTLLLSSIGSAWSSFTPENTDETESCFKELNKSIDILKEKQVLFDIGDETVIEKHAYVSDGKLFVGKCGYSTVVITQCSGFLPSTEKILDKFQMCGGNICYAEDIKQNELCNNSSLTYTARRFDDCTIHFFFNDSPQTQTAAFTCGSKLIDLASGETQPFYGICDLEPRELIVFIDDSSPTPPRPFKKQLKELRFEQMWQYRLNNENLLVIDRCNVFVDGEKKEENISAADVIFSLYSSGASPSKIKCEYKFTLLCNLDNIYLACETPQYFKIDINGNELTEFKDCHLPAAQKADISEFLLLGENTVSFEADFIQSEKIRDMTAKREASDLELDNFSLAFEFAPIYIIGDFAAETKSNFITLDKNSVRHCGDFALKKLPEALNPEHIEKSGFPFFTGSITFTRSFNISDTLYYINPHFYGASDIFVSVNGKRADLPTPFPYRLDIHNLLQKGENTIEITLTSNTRNLFGPFHIPIGEISPVYARHFYRTDCVLNNFDAAAWNDDYCLCRFGFENL